VGCQLGVPRNAPQPADNTIDLYKAMNNTSRHIGDYDFIHENPIYKPLVAVSTTHVGNMLEVWTAWVACCLRMC
jgi:hypothetical protein